VAESADGTSLTMNVSKVAIECPPLN